MTRIQGREALSRPFRYRLELYPDQPLDTQALIGKPYTLHLPLSNGATRPLNGVVTRIEQGLATVRSTRYVLELRPWFSLLALERRCAVFQNLSVPEIVTRVCAAAGCSDVRNALTGTYAPREYTVQYGESSFAFLSRLMEEAGIFYFFEHSEDTHTLVLADAPEAFFPCAGGAALSWLPGGEGETGTEEVVSRLATPSARLFGVSLIRQSGVAACTVDDYNYLTPETRLRASTGEGFPCREYPLAGHDSQQEGETLAGIRLDSHETVRFLLRAASFCSGLAAGARFTVREHPDAAVNAAWAVMEVRFRAMFPGNGSAEGGVFRAEVTAAPAMTRHRPALTFHRPVLSGHLTAVVTGKSGEKIWTDQHGRCKIRFHWDDDAKHAHETSSCWVRVAQPWTGRGFGAAFPPRVGQEVIVSFEGGNPDRPLITGMVYNTISTPPWPLPENAARCGVRGRSLSDQGPPNEWYMDDRSGEEKFYVHAQKTLEYAVEAKRTATIVGEGGDELVLEKGSRNTEIREGGDTLALSKGSRSVQIDEGDDTLTVKGRRIVKIGGDAEVEISGNYTLKVSGDLVLQAGGSVKISSGTEAALSSGTNLELKAKTGLTTKAGTALSQSAGTTFDIKATGTGTVDGGTLLVAKAELVKIN